jgi:selenocysteine-specific elongation factor
MRVIGTAGHVDHGKSTLVQALTGTHPDRLKEEREREMTIDLGFAFLTLPGGVEAGIIDVPGHRDFIENMLAGVGGLDAALFVVAADEGIMPQTAEHLAILNLLGIPGGVVALTKIDLAADPDWLDLVEQELREALSRTTLAAAPMVRVSARRGDGIPELINALARVLHNCPPRQDLGQPRLPVDRVFSVAGFGTVVTGTLVDGQLRVGDEVEIYPAGRRARIRGLQSHNRQEDAALPGSRTAVNLAGVAHHEVQRGNWIALPGAFEPSRRLDTHINLLADASRPLAHDDEVKLFLGAAEIVGRARPLGGDSVPPGGSGWVQLELRQPVIAARSDRFILRRPSPGETFGGGTVVDAQPPGRHKRFAASVISRLESLSRGSPGDLLLQAILAEGALSLRDAARRAGLSLEVALPAGRELLAAGSLIHPDDGGLHAASLLAGRAFWEGYTNRLLEHTSRFHAAYPLRRGIPREELKSRAGGSVALFNAALRVLAASGSMVDEKGLARLAGHAVRFSAAQQESIRKLDAAFAAEPFAPPSVKQAQELVGAEVYAALVEAGDYVQVSVEVAFRQVDYERLLRETAGIIGREGGVTVASFRDHFQTSRKYALAFLEHLDATGVTARDGDVRWMRLRG